MTITTTAASVFRDYATDGVPASGEHEPVKADIRTLFGTIDTTIDGAGYQTGDFKLAMRTSIPAGWIEPNGSIGNASSNATNRANADTEDLFTLWWTEFTGWQLQDSSGSNVARGASAAADFAAGKRMPVPDVRDRYPRVWKDDLGGGFSSAVGENMADALQYHAHTYVSTDEVLDPPGVDAIENGSLDNAADTGAIGGPTDQSDHDAVRVAEETRPRSTVFRGFFKL